MEAIGLKKETIRNSLWEFFAKTMEKFGVLLFTIILARFLLPEGFGVYTLVLSVSLLFTSFINYGVDNTLIRYVSHSIGKRNKNLASSYFRYILKVKLFLSLIASFLLMLLAYPIAVYFFNKPFIFLPLFITGFYVFLLSLETFGESLFYIFRQVKGRFIKEIIKQISKVALVLIVFYLVAKSYRVIGVILVLILSTLIVLFFLFFYTKKFANYLFEKEAEEKIDKKRVLKFMIYLTLTSFSGILFSYVDIVMIGAFLPEIKYAGLYNSAVTFVWGIAGVFGFTSLFLPVFTQIKEGKLEQIFNKVIKYFFILAIPASFGIAALSKYIVVVIYGYEYLNAWIILFIYSFLLIEVILASFVVTIFSVKERLSLITFISILTLLLTIILNFLFIKSLLPISQLSALIGAAIATLISRYIFLITIVILMKKRLKIKIEKSNWTKPLLCSIIMFFSLIGLNKIFIKNLGLFSGLFEIGFGIMVYFFFLFVIKGFSKEEFEFRDIKEIFIIWLKIRRS